MRKIENIIKVEMDSNDLDMMIEKANRLVELLQEAQRIISSLVENKKLES